MSFAIPKMPDHRRQAVEELTAKSADGESDRVCSTLSEKCGDVSDEGKAEKYANFDAHAGHGHAGHDHDGPTTMPRARSLKTRLFDERVFAQPVQEAGGDVFLGCCRRLPRCLESIVSETMGAPTEAPLLRSARRLR